MIRNNRYNFCSRFRNGFACQLGLRARSVRCVLLVDCARHVAGSLDQTLTGTKRIVRLQLIMGTVFLLLLVGHCLVVVKF